MQSLKDVLHFNGASAAVHSVAVSRQLCNSSASKWLIEP